MSIASSLKRWACSATYFGVLVAHQRRAFVVGQRPLQHVFHLVDHRREGRGDLGGAFGLGLLERLLERLALVFREAHAARELLRVDDDAFDARGHFERVVLHVFAGPAEDGVQQFFFRRQLGLRLGRDLAHQDVARPDVGADPHDAVLVEVAQGLFADVGNVAGELLAAQLGLANFDVELFDVDRGVGVVLHQLFADDDGVLEVEPVPDHEADQHVAAQGQFALEGGGAVGDRLRPFRPSGRSATIGFWFWQVRSLRPTNLRSVVDLAADFDPRRRRRR